MGVDSALGSGATRWTLTDALGVLLVTLGATGVSVAVLVVVGLGAAVLVVLGVAVSVETTCRSSVGRWWSWLIASANPPPMAPAATSDRAPAVHPRALTTRHPRTGGG